MIQSTAGRAIGLSRLPNPKARIGISYFSTTAHVTARLSAIHRGLRRSDRAQFGAPRDRNDDYSRNSWKNERENLTSKAMGGAASTRQQHKLKKKLTRKEREQLEEDSDKQTRRKRFLDPESEFGKNSLVYQLKHGRLRDEVSMDKVKQPVRPVDRRPIRNDGGFGSTNRDTVRDDYQGRGRTFAGRDRQFTRERRMDDRRPNGGFDSYQRQPRRNAPQSETDAHNEDRPSPHVKRGGFMPMTVQYTTAASQFLYGRSVVKAALEQDRRQLYKLYVQSGENRSDSNSITRLAERRGLTVVNVPSEQQRMMDKMSMGRPHNGFVLETSPLPQLPVTALGAVEESPARLGFHIDVGFQTKEEMDINGNNSFVKRASNVTPRPFVLLLHEILDPGNLGALLRTASYLGVDAVGITSRSSSTLTPVVLKSAAGAVEETTIFTVDSPVEFLEGSKKAGWKTFAAVAPPEQRLVDRHSEKFLSVSEIEEKRPLSNDPCILVLGNEGHGLPKGVKVAADYEVSVPRYVQNSCVDSLNVSVAAALLCQSFVSSSITKPSGAHGVSEQSSSKDTTGVGESLF